jgi:hypothetical protein
VLRKQKQEGHIGIKEKIRSICELISRSNNIENASYGKEITKTREILE